MRKSMLARLIQRVPIGQLGQPELTHLLRGGHSFQFGGDGGLHTHRFFLSNRKTERSAVLPPTSEAYGYPHRKTHEYEREQLK